MEGSNVYGMVDVYKMSLVSDLVFPPKFKVSTFDKYDGTKCPSSHLYTYCRKMTGYTSNDKLLIHCFQDSLSGSATRWYNFLSRDQIKSWTDLAKAFLVQYKHMTDTSRDIIDSKHIAYFKKIGYMEIRIFTGQSMKLD